MWRNTTEKWLKETGATQDTADDAWKGFSFFSYWYEKSWCLRLIVIFLKYIKEILHHCNKKKRSSIINLLYLYLILTNSAAGFYNKVICKILKKTSYIFIKIVKASKLGKWESKRSNKCMYINSLNVKILCNDEENIDLSFCIHTPQI